MALFNNFPYSNTEEINLDYTLNKLNELYSRGENLYAELQAWKTETDEANEAWKSDLLSDINEWQNSVTHSLEEWKTSVDSEVTNAITNLSNQITDELAQAKIDLRAEVADLASEAAASAADATASQSAAAQSAQSAINSATAAAQSEQNITESAEQIETNKNDIADLKSAIEYNPITFINGYYIKTDGSTVDWDNPIQGATANNYAVLDAKEGDQFTLNGTGGNAGRLWCFCDSTGNVLSVAESNITATNLIITAPANSYKLILNPVTGYGVCLVGVMPSERYAEIDRLKNAIDGTPITCTYNLTKGRYLFSRQTVGQAVVLDTSAGLYTVIDLNISAGGYYIVSSDSITSNNTVACVFTDDNDIVISKHVTRGGSNPFMVLNPDTGRFEHKGTNPIGAKKLCFSIYDGSDSISYEYYNPLVPNINRIFVSADGDDNNNGLIAEYPKRTFSAAIDSGADTVDLLTDIDLTNTISINRNIIINGNGHTIYGDTALTVEPYNNIVRAPYAADTRITNCYIDQTTPLTETVTGSSWKGDKYNIACYADDQKLIPVTDIATCESTVNSCAWSDGYWYINATATRYSYVTMSNAVSITSGHVIINDIAIKHCMSNIISAADCNLDLNGVKIIGSVNLNCVTVEDGQLTARDCETAYSWNDGLNAHGRGESTIINCYCHDCSDDGISQHDNTIGVIIGGEYCRCGKGGISSPINSAKVDIYGAYIHDNTGSAAYGIYASNSSGITQTFRIWDCVIKNNRIGIKIVGHQALAYGCKLADNATDISTETGGTVTYLD